MPTPTAPTLLPVILAGGTGSRLWPLSREHYPKQFLRLTGDKSLLQNTALRAMHLPGVENLMLLCNEQHRFLVAEQLQEVAAPLAALVLEPEGRNTAPACAAAAHHAMRLYGPDVVLFVMAADHLIREHKAFDQAVAQAVEQARAGHIVTFGITPTGPETGFGYIRAPGAGAAGAAIEAFVEKPDRSRAEGFLAAGGYYWNGGMFLFTAGTFLAELKRLEPDMYEASKAAVEQAATDLDFVRLDRQAFARCREDSLDYAVMERTDRAWLVPLDAGWDDVGSWSFLATLNPDEAGNVTRGDVLLEGAHNNLVHAESRLVALAGVTDMIVIETADAVLVAPRDRAQDVKKIVTRLKAAKRPEAADHPKVFRPWGAYETLVLGPRFQVKRISVKPGQKLSLQMHHHRAEHWIVVTGTARVTCDGKEFILTENQSCYLPLGATHRLENPGKLPLELIEVQSGAYLGEDDIVRFEDVYGRTPGPAST